MNLVLDVSAILGLAFPDEDPTYAKAILDALKTADGIVPTLFWFELRNALVMGERRGRTTADQTALFLAELNLLPFEVDDEPREDVVLCLARRRSLTIYDATYLELAQRRNLKLATMDRALRSAAPAEGVMIWEP